MCQRGDTVNDVVAGHCTVTGHVGNSISVTCGMSFLLLRSAVTISAVRKLLTLTPNVTVGCNGNFIVSVFSKSKCYKLGIVRSTMKTNLAISF